MQRAIGTELTTETGKGRGLGVVLQIRVEVVVHVRVGELDGVHIGRGLAPVVFHCGEQLGRGHDGDREVRWGVRDVKINDLVFG